jgi:hypothetical protein
MTEVDEFLQMEEKLSKLEKAWFKNKNTITQIRKGGINWP